MAANEAPAPRSIARGTLAVLGIAFGLTFLYVFRHVLLTLSIALVAGIALRSFCDRIAALGLSRRGATSVALVVVLGALLSLTWLLLPFVIDGFETFLARLPLATEAVRAQLLDSPNLILRRLGESLPRDRPSSSWLHSG